ncbi:MAG TPA: VIT domain-containing protein, partial [Kofleriaceae bacterium]|nr:VIT domain-containing protein [Kofleriaceae bacterium]
MKLRVACLLLAACSNPSSPPPRLPPPPQGAAEARSFADLGSPVVLAAAMDYPEPVMEQTAPLSLTSSDGTGLQLRSLDARAVVEGPLAFTELHLAFANPEDRQIEGRFAITLPPGAAISRLAMKIDTGWQEAEMVERMAARRAYEDFLHRKQDPALLEQEAGNEFSARIFPIPAKGVKEIIVSFSHELTGDAPYRLPLVGLPEIADLKVEVRRARVAGTGWETTALARQHWKPDLDVEAPVPSAGGLVAGDLVALRVAAPVADDLDRIGGAVVLFDTSASRAPGFAGEVDRLGKLLAALAAEHGGMQLTLATFDHEVVPVYIGAAAEVGRAPLDAILARRPLGASDLGAALRWAATQKDRDRVIVVGDAVSTAGARGPALTALARDLGHGHGYQRLDLVLVGGIRDDQAAIALARGTLAHDGAVIDGALPEATIAHRLGRRTASGISVSVPGATWVWPDRLDGVQPGDETIVYAQLRQAHTPGMPIKITLGGPIGRDLSITPVKAARPLLERAAARARIARMSVDRDRATDAKKREQIVADIVALSTRYRVLSDHTALLVLETEADYQRFGIERHALADILAVGAGGVEVIHRAAPVVMVEPEQPPPPRELDLRAKKKVELAKESEEGIAGKRIAGDDDDGGEVGADKDTLGRLVDDPAPEEKPEEPAKPDPVPAGPATAEPPPPPPARITARPPADNAPMARRP